MKKVSELSVNYRGLKVGILSLTPDDRLCAFEYDKAWILNGFSISPLELPLKDGVFIARPLPFNGAFGIFEDSLPDGYGRYLLHKALMREGVDDSIFSALDRLSIVGENGMGALTYSPVRNMVSSLELDDFDALQRKALEVLRERQDDDAELLLFNSGNSGGARPKAVFSDAEGHWLVKFRHIYDPADIGAMEFDYNEAARRCGIEVPDFKLVNGRYFASRRFDITDDGNRIHTATAGALLGVAHTQPILDYENLLALTGYLTQDASQVREMFRRMLFNYFTDNMDDHSKNFSFFIDDSDGNGFRWKLAPAYDLTFSTTGYNGQHSTSVNGTGHPVLSDFIAVGKKSGISEAQCRNLIEEVKAGVGNLLKYKI